MKFSREEMIEILEDKDDVVRDEITDTGRWSIHHELIFRKDGQLYRTHYSVGATECQDEGPWEYDTEVNCTPVEAFGRTITAYRPL